MFTICLHNIFNIYYIFTIYIYTSICPSSTYYSIVYTFHALPGVIRFQAIAQLESSHATGTSARGGRLSPRGGGPRGPRRRISDGRHRLYTGCTG